MSVLARFQGGNFLLKGELNERLPAITSGLVAHFPFDGITASRENINPVQNINTTINFSGINFPLANTDARIELNSNIVAPSGTISWEAQGGHTTGIRAWISISNGTNRTQVSRDGNLVSIWSNGAGDSFTLASWGNVFRAMALTWTGTTMRLFIDGLPQLTRNSGLFPTNHLLLTLGNTPGPTWTNVLGGIMRNVSVYNRVLTDQEIIRL